VHEQAVMFRQEPDQHDHRDQQEVHAGADSSLAHSPKPPFDARPTVNSQLPQSAR
jgi:hypothetical protein